MTIRKEILEFAEEMERVMSKHDENKGESWKTCQLGYLEDKLDDVFYELDDDKPEEFVDVAKLCMMLWYRSCEKKVKKAFKSVENRR